MKMNVMKMKRFVLAGIAAVAMKAVAAGPSLPYQCQYIFSIKDCYGYLDVGSTVAIWTIDDNGNLGTKLAEATATGSPVGAGASVICYLQTDPGDAKLVAVTSANDAYGTYHDGSNKRYISIPSPTFIGFIEVVGLLGQDTTDENTEGEGMPAMYILGMNDATGDYFSDNGYPKASDDLDGDGKTTLEEFYAGTDPTGGQMAELGFADTLTLKDWSVDENGKATVKIERAWGHSYTIRWTKENPAITSLGQNVPAGTRIKFATSENGTANTEYLYEGGDSENYDLQTTQVWFQLPDVKEDYYVGIAVDGVLCAYTKIAAASASHTITWQNDDGTEIGTTTVADGETPEHTAPAKTADAPYAYIFTGWTPAITAASADATYKATFLKVADLTLANGDWTATDGDIITNTTAHTVTIPAGASVTVNGVSIRGATGGAALPAPEFSADGQSATTKFAKTASGAWTLTAFAELANDAIGADVQEDQIKVYAAGSLKELKDAKPLEAGFTVKEKKSAVKATIEVAAPADAKQQFFKVEFGK